ncbi:transcriptional regulator [Asanoa siamensis]|uniref:MarR family transcriptional regulator n=1 Tax=Asanoa siamensis TaxID=926357 RepID=A0ABQ4CNX1_9ACTN|nr:transcriptional regulator [Asanoa siamensis]GIF72547.1 MarR family transcriptional regulator [Asanoa siamensis]
MIDGLDPIIHVPKRLAAMGILANAPTVSFRFLRDHLRLGESDLSKQMSTLESAGYVTATKDGRGRGASTTYRMTSAGRQAYEAHCAALRALLDGTASPSGPV